MRTTLSLIAMMMVLGTSLAGCGDDTGGTGGGSADDDTTSTSATSGNGATTSTTSTGSGDGPKTCEDVCDYQPTATEAQADCVGVDLQLKGYPVATTASCNDIDSIATCNDCYVDIAVTDADCVATFTKCY